MSFDPSRLRELLVRLVAPGCKAEHVSASECHEIVDDATEALRHLAIYETKYVTKFSLDAALAKNARLSRELSEARGEVKEAVALAQRSFNDWRPAVETAQRETAERIAAWLDENAALLRKLNGPDDADAAAVASIASDVRDGAWRKEPRK